MRKASTEKKHKGPFLAYAAICQMVLQEKDDVPSLIRCIDRMTISAATAAMPPATIQICIVVGFKSGGFKGTMKLKLTGHSPSGKKMNELVSPAIFEGDEHGPMIQANTNFTATEAGLHWFSVSLDSRFVTKIPFRVVYQQTPSESTAMNGRSP